MNTGFGYSAELLDRFPQVHGEVLLVTGFQNRAPLPALHDAYLATQAEVGASLETTPAAERPSIKAWRSVFSQLGVKPTQHRNAAEALLRRLARHGDIPSINPAVDMGNTISIGHALPVAIFDVARLSGGLTVGFANGDESFTGIGAAEPEQPQAGEVVFIDDGGHIAARRWCWKQSGNSATNVDTTVLLVVIEAVHDRADEAVKAAADDFLGLVSDHQPGTVIARSEVHAAQPAATLG